MMVCLVMLLVLLESSQWIRVYQVGFIMLQLIMKKLLKIMFSLKIHLNKKIIMEFGHTFCIVKNFWCIGFNEGVWIHRNPITFPKNIEFWIVLWVQNSSELPKRWLWKEEMDNQYTFKLMK